MITQFKIFENIDNGLKLGDIVICTHEKCFGKKFKVARVFGPNLKLKGLDDNVVSVVWSKDYFVKEEDWELYKNTQKYNI